MAISTDTMHPALSSRTTVAVNLALAAAIIGGWLALHVWAVFLFDLAPSTAWAAPLIMALQCWLSVGLFIVAHDCMHGSLVPLRPAINRAVGRLCLTLYAGFPYDALNRKHHLHHRHAGTEHDPDFHEAPPHTFWPWFAKFFREYFGWREVTFMGIVSTVYMFVLDAPTANVLLFWALPAVLSALQLFYFGTYLPHKPGHDDFTDRHRSRSNNFSWITSLLTCFHFGYHHEHHLYPGLPWWKLPGAFRKSPDRLVSQMSSRPSDGVPPQAHKPA